MRRGLSLTGALLVALALTATGEVAAQQPPDKEPDNTGINQRDRQPDAVTADKQKGNPDADITRQIRQAIVKEKAVSHYAHNVKVVTQDGVVTLRGPVRSEQEKDAVQAIAVRVAGESNVKNELEVVPPQKGSN